MKQMKGKVIGGPFDGGVLTSNLGNGFDASVFLKVKTLKSKVFGEYKVTNVNLDDLKCDLVWVKCHE